MKRTLLLTLVTCGFVSLAQAQFTNETMTVGTATRNYRQYLPTGFNASSEPGLPLVIAMHGLGDNATNFSNVGFQYIADTARFIVVYPNGTLNGFGQNGWNNGTLLSSSADDISFISRIIDTMYVRHNIDLAKVYVTGFSMGGIMSYHALCALPERIASIASVSGTMSNVDLSSCNPGRAVPIMHMHGTADGTVPYSGSALPSLSLVPQTIGFWQNNNGCTDSTVTSLPNLVAGDSITVDRLDYNTCSEPVQLWRENNADHEWLYYPVNDITATIEIWLFFRNKVHPSPSLLTIAEPNTQQHFNIASNANGLVITSTASMQEMVITDMQGRNVVNVKGNLGQNQVVNLATYSHQPLLVNVNIDNSWYRKKFIWVK